MELIYYIAQTFVLSIADAKFSDARLGRGSSGLVSCGTTLAGSCRVYLMLKNIRKCGEGGIGPGM